MVYYLIPEKGCSQNIQIRDWHVSYDRSSPILLSEMLASVKPVVDCSWVVVQGSFVRRFVTLKAL